MLPACLYLHLSPQHGKTAGSSCNSSMFSNIAVNTVISVFVCTRERVSPFNLQFRNLRVAPKHCQVNIRIGNPVPLYSVLIVTEDVKQKKNNICMKKIFVFVYPFKFEVFI